MTDREILSLKDRKLTDRERLSNVKKMREKVVMHRVTDMKTYRGLKSIEEALKQKIRLSEVPEGGGGGPRRA